MTSALPPQADQLRGENAVVGGNQGATLGKPRQDAAYKSAKRSDYSGSFGTLGDDF